jgi:hypothetical protein
MLRQRVKEALGEMRKLDPTETEVMAVGRSTDCLRPTPWMPAIFSSKNYG